MTDLRLACLVAAALFGSRAAREQLDLLTHRLLEGAQ